MEYLISILIAVAVGYGLHLWASRGLRIETKKLRHLNQLILLALQNNDMADLRFGKDGENIGLNVTIKMPSAKVTQMRLQAAHRRSWGNMSDKTFVRLLSRMGRRRMPSTTATDSVSFNGLVRRASPHPPRQLRPGPRPLSVTPSG